MHLFVSGPDRTSAKGFVFVHKHAQHGVLDVLITRPIWVFRCRSPVDISPACWSDTCPFLVLGIGKELRTCAMVDIMTPRCP
jgi:hypothetical protein